jgi:hypothetical protein
VSARPLDPDDPTFVSPKRPTTDTQPEQPRARSRARHQPAPRPRAELRTAVLAALDIGGTSSQIAINVRSRRTAVEEVLAELEAEGLAKRRSRPWGGWARAPEAVDSQSGQRGTVRERQAGLASLTEAQTA